MKSICLLWYIYTKDGCFCRDFHILQSKIDGLFQSKHMSSQMSLIVISVDNSGVAGGNKAVDLSLITIVNNWINNKTLENNTYLSTLICDCSII